MKRTEELITQIAALRREDLELWVAETMIRPVDMDGEQGFTDDECARIQLICTLHYEMDVETYTLPIILDLIDQLHETRRRLRALGGAVLSQDEAVRAAILDRVKTTVG